MGFEVEDRRSDSPYVESVMHGYTVGSGETVRPAEIHWHMVLVKHPGGVQFIVTGPLTTSGVVGFEEGIELLWIKFRIGAFMPHMPATSIRDSQTVLPTTRRDSFWLKDAAWQFPNFENVEPFVDHLVRAEVLAFDPMIEGTLQGERHELAPRTVRHRFLHATGLTQNQIYQVQRVQQAQGLLESGASIFDAVEQAGYYDQPHLTRALRQWVGHTPGQIIEMSRANCHFVQDTASEISDNEWVID